MIPSTEQKLRSVRHTVAATIMPAIGADDPFAREQAGLVLATLDWILDVQASEYRYDVVEHDDAVALLSALRALRGEVGTGSADAGPVDRPTDLTELRAATLDAKRAAEALFTELAETDQADAAWAAMSAAARRQAAREVAAARMTGFPKAQQSIAEVLAEQERSAPTAAAESDR